MLPLADQLLTRAGLEWDSIQRIAVGVGPGTFTGLRVGVATARGLAQSLSLDLVGVSRLQALAHHGLAEDGREPISLKRGGQRLILAAIDARRGEIFAEGWSAAGELFTARALAPDDLGELLGHQGPGSVLEHHDWLAVGDGAIRFRAHFEGCGIEVPPDSSPLHRIRGADICELALDAESDRTKTVLPDYLRRPDAEIALQGAAG